MMYAQNRKIPALGRWVSLGQIYDCRSDSVLPTYLWDEQTVGRTSNTRPQRSSDHSVTVDDNVKDKMETLGIEGELMVSILGELVSLAGSSLYLKDQKVSRNKEKVTLKYNCTTRYDELDMEKLKKERVSRPDVFADGAGTHVVCGILYGGQALFVFDGNGSDGSGSQRLHETVRGIPDLGMENGHIIIPRSLEDDIIGVRCQVYSDFKMPYKPNDYKSAARLFKSLTHFVEGSGTQAVPVEIVLYPLYELDSIATRVVRGIANNIVSQLEQAFSHLDGVVIDCHDMLYSPAVRRFQGMKKNIEEFQQLVTSYKKYLQQRIGPVITKLRGGNVSENVLEDILAERESSPFDINQLDVWMKQKRVQLETLSHNDPTSANQLDDCNITSVETSSASPIGTPAITQPSIPSDKNHSTSTQKDTSSRPAESTHPPVNPATLLPPSNPCLHEDDGDRSHHKVAVCFHVSMQGKHSLTKAMDSSLQRVTSGFLQKFVPESDFHVNHEAHADTLLQAELFKDFVEANRCNNDLKFSFAEDVDTTNKLDVYVSVSRNGEILHDIYQPPSAPGPPRLEKAQHDCLQIQWAKPEHGDKNVTHYEIQYKETSGSCSETVQTDAKPGKNVLKLTDLNLGSAYNIQIRALCEIGSSVWGATTIINTLPATPPGKPVATHKVPNGVHVQWPKPLKFAQNRLVQSYIISVHDLTAGETFDVPYDPKNGEEYTFQNLKPTSTYAFCVRAAFAEGETEAGQESDILEPRPNTVMKGELLKKSKKIKGGSPGIYQLNLEQVLLKRNERIRKCRLGDSQYGVKEKVIMVVGATGAGKTTLINGLVNYILGVDWKDNFRFQLIVDTEEAQQHSQAESQTRWITSYTLHHQKGFEVPYTLTVIDTPGFGDTSGIKRDQEITQQIRNFFTTKGDEGIDHIDAIGFVMQASLPRLTPTQRFIFDQVLALFGKDIAENIFLLVTFAIGQKPPVLEGVKAADIPYRGFFKFNNSALYAENSEEQPEAHGRDRDVVDSDYTNEEDKDKVFWKMGEKSFSTFLQSLNNTESKSLVLTKDVLNERQRLETHVSGIQQHIRTGLNKLEQLRIEVDVLMRHETNINMNKDFTYTVTEETVKTVNIPSGTYITNCLNCNSTCHYPCRIPDDANKRGCAAMDRTEGVCRICPSRCVWNVHKNMSYRFEIEQVTKTKTAEELKARYEAASGEKLSAEQLVKKVIDDFENEQVKVVLYTDEVRKSLDRLKDIALKPNPLVNHGVHRHPHDVRENTENTWVEGPTTATT